jgi:hypothetical protein
MGNDWDRYENTGYMEEEKILKDIWASGRVRNM